MQLTVICVDNSTLVTSIYGGGGVYKAQAKAIALYCKEKFKVCCPNFMHACMHACIIRLFIFIHSFINIVLQAHPDNEVGLLAMGVIQGTGFVGPTRDLHRICSKLKGSYFPLLFVCMKLHHYLIINF